VPVHPAFQERHSHQVDAVVVPLTVAVLKPEQLRAQLSGRASDGPSQHGGGPRRGRHPATITDTDPGSGREAEAFCRLRESTRRRLGCEDRGGAQPADAGRKRTGNPTA